MDVREHRAFLASGNEVASQMAYSDRLQDANEVEASELVKSVAPMWEAYRKLRPLTEEFKWLLDGLLDLPRDEQPHDDKQRASSPESSPSSTHSVGVPRSPASGSASPLSCSKADSTSAKHQAV